MTRELSNKMYTPVAYFLGRLLSQFMIQFIPPIIMFLMLFWCLAIDQSWNNLLWLLGFSIVGNFTWAAMGFFVGLTIPDESDGAKVINVMLCMIFMSVNGGIVNPSTTNAFVRFLSRVTPARFICEGFFICFT